MELSSDLHQDDFYLLRSRDLGRAVDLSGGSGEAFGRKIAKSIVSHRWTKQSGGRSQGLGRAADLSGGREHLLMVRINSVPYQI